MSSVIAVHPRFDAIWPFAADRFQQLWQREGTSSLVRLKDANRLPVGQVIGDPGSVTRLVALDVPVTSDCVRALASLREAVIVPEPAPDIVSALERVGCCLYRHPSEGFWGQSVSEFALALTLCGLRRIPQLHHAMLTRHDPWDYRPPGGVGQPGARGQQFGDDTRFANGTISGKRVRIVGAGNIASRYASFVHMLGADVAAWDPYAPEPSFHRSGARKEWHLDRLLRDAEIFAPMVPLTDTTVGMLTADHIATLPRGCLVILATRAAICDVDAIRTRVLADELSLAADVFDVEPLPLDDPLLGRHNVVHTPHNAGRTIDANRRWAETLAEQFRPHIAGDSPQG